MLRKLLCSKALVPVLLCLQVVPLVVLPLSSFSLTSQEWWLPAFLALLSVISVIKLLVGRTISKWPWYLLSFSQGFNIISRLMMLMPHATSNVEGVQILNLNYIVIAVVAMLLSMFWIWYCELPEVRAHSVNRISSRKLA